MLIYNSKSPKKSKPILRLSLDTLLLDTLLRHRAFRAPDIVSVAQLKDLEIPLGKEGLFLPLREDLDDVPLFHWVSERIRDDIERG
jgi:hypothetical protein